MKAKDRKHVVVSFGFGLGLAGCAVPVPAADQPAVSYTGGINPEAAAEAFPKRGFPPCAKRNYPTRPLRLPLFQT